MFLKQVIDAKDIATGEGLRYVSDTKPGITRQRKGKHFAYLDQQGKAIKDADIIQRIQKIGIPPAYVNVWICPTANGHIQATGFDAKGRKQYRYHAKWREARDQNKFDHILMFGEALPQIRRRVAKDLEQPGLPRTKIIATIISLLEKTLIRIGNNEYARQNNSYGLTTLRCKHVDVAKDTIRFHFKGKSGKEWNLAMHDRRIAAIIRNCSHLPGYDLFKYKDENGVLHPVSSCDVNAYLKDITQQDFTAKDFRTWSGTVLAALALKEYVKYDSAAQAKKNVVQAIEKTARQLGNTPSICRKSYVHPEILNAYMAGELVKMIETQIAEKFRTNYRHLTSEEIMVLAFLQKRLKKRGKGSSN